MDTAGEKLSGLGRGKKALRVGHAAVSGSKARPNFGKAIWVMSTSIPAFSLILGALLLPPPFTCTHTRS